MGEDEMATYEVKARETKYSGTLYDIYVDGQFEVSLSAFRTHDAAMRVVDLRTLSVLREVA